MATDDELRAEAKQRLHARRNLGAQIVVYCAVGALLVAIWALSGGGYFWPAWALLGWGFALAVQVWHVYFRRPVTEHDIEQEMKRLQR